MKDLLKRLTSKNISIGVIDDQLDINAPKGTMTAELLSEIKENKGALVSFISEYKSDNGTDISIPKTAEKSGYSLTSSQLRLWHIEQSKINNGNNNISCVFRLNGNVNINDLKIAYSKLIERHEILRSNISLDIMDGSPQLVITPTQKNNSNLEYSDISKEENNSLFLQQTIDKEVSYNFDLESDNLVRVTLLKTSSNDFNLIIVMHQIISDRWSSTILISDLFSLYHSVTQNEETFLEPLPIQFKDFAEWQQSNMNSFAIEKDKKYWLEQFSKEVPKLEVPTFKIRPSIRTYECQTIEKHFDKDVIDGFRKLCKTKGATSFMGLLSVLKILLYKYTNQTDIVIGSPFSGREHTELQNQIGFYANTVGLRSTFKQEDTFGSLLNQVKKTTLDAYTHQNYPFDDLMKNLGLNDDSNENPLFEIMMTVESLEENLDSISSIKAFDITEIDQKRATGKFDLEFDFKEDKEGIKLRLTYNTDIYDEFFIERMIAHYENLMSHVINNLNDPISSIKYSGVERKLVSIWQEVLGVDRIGITDNFFEFGGHSLNITQILNKITKRFEVSMSYKEFVNNPTILALSTIIANKNKLTNVLVKIPKTEVKEFYELSRAQYRLWVTSNIGGTKAYNISGVYTIEEDINREYFELAVRQIVKRHNSLRTTFKLNSKNKVHQYVTPYEDYELAFVQGENLSEDKIREIVKREIDIEVDLENGPVFKVGLLGTEEGTFVFYFLFHHIVSDGWSVEVFQKELIENYFFLLENGYPIERDELDIQFQDFSTWINNDLNGIIKDQKEFWHSVFEKPIDVLKLPFERPDRPLKKNYNGDIVFGSLDAEVTTKLKALAKELNATTFSSLLSVYKILIYKYTGLNNITIGTPISGRINSQLELQLGLYINTLPVRTEFNVNDSFNQLNKDQNEKLLGFYNNELYQIDQLIEELSIQVIPGRSPFFDTMVVYQNQADIKLFEKREDVTKYGIDSLQNANNNFQSQFDLSVAFSDNADGELNISIFFNTDVFEKEFMERFIDDYCYLMSYRLSHSNESPEDFFYHTSYQFINDKDIVFKRPIKQLTNDEITPESLESNEIKDKLQLILSSHLDKEIAYHEDFYKLGGSSLQTITITDEINEEFNTDFSVIDVYQNSTVNELYSLFSITTEQNDVKDKLKQILSTHLGKELSYHDDYFKLGGSSLQTISITDEINREFNTNFNIIDVYQNSTVNDLYELLPSTNEQKEIKDKIQKILSSHLGREISYYDDYYKVGGSSLHTISIAEDINKEFGSDFNIIDVYNNSSVEDIYDLLISDNGSTTSVAFPVIELLSEKYSEEKDNIIFFPPIVGIGKIFKPLTNFISRKYNCYAINVPIFEEELSFESKAAFFYDEIIQRVGESNQKIVLAGYSIGANFAFETAKLFSKNMEVEVVLIDRPAEFPKVAITADQIKEAIGSQTLLVEMAKQFTSEEDIVTRIEQTMKGLSGYELSGKLERPIHTFECDGNQQKDYMKEWTNYTQDFKGVNNLQGNHFQALEEDNLFYLANFFNKGI